MGGQKTDSTRAGEGYQNIAGSYIRLRLWLLESSVGGVWVSSTDSVAFFCSPSVDSSVQTSTHLPLDSTS